ncbi:LysR family transcriptional regulator [Kitasatospora sp. NPDC048296]|uniref:LysR family transcriptional regulator n=1 Tax=Kitasatospora sp. NPDC048296 TaxID=3364048 RepID=UPI003712F01C
MNSQQLTYFLAVAEHGSLGHAAAALDVAQPSLSQALGVLERELGTPLLHRLNRGAVLTPAGQAFVPHARRLLRELRRARDVIDQSGGNLTGVLDFVTTPVLAVTPGAGLLGRFRKLFPDVQVRVHIAEQDADVPPALAGGRAEIALTYLPLREPALAVHELGTHDLLAVFPPGEPGLADPLPVRELAERDAVGVTGASSQQQLVADHLAAHGVRLRVAVEVAHREMVVPLVLTGAGMSFLPGPLASWAATRGAQTRQLTPALRQPYGLAYLPGQLTPVGTALADLAQQVPASRFHSWEEQA